MADSVSIGDVQIVEGNAGSQTACFTVLRSGGTAPFTVDFATADNTATVADGDYDATSGTLSFGANVTSQIIAVTINGDTKVEPNESFFVNLSGATAGATISQSQGTGIISNDDVANQAPVITSGGGGSSPTYDLKVNFSAIAKLTATDADSGSSLTFS